MHKIIKKKKMAENTNLFEIRAPVVAKKARSGQFVILRVDENGERIPMTIVDFDRDRGTITIVAQEIGKTTTQLGKLGAGDSIVDLVGPLGHPSEIMIFGTVVLIGGGTGIACIYPIARDMKKAGNKVISIIGARNKDLLFFREEIKSFSSEFYITTDDGSEGQKGFVSDVLKKIMNEKKVNRVITIGPVIMMKVVSELTEPSRIKTIVSLNPIMVDGTGMCGSCRVSVGGETKLACVDGPEFDGHKVDFNNLMLRNKMFCAEEKSSMERHACTCGKRKKLTLSK